MMDYWESSRFDAIAVALHAMKGASLRLFLAENDVDDEELADVLQALRELRQDPLVTIPSARRWQDFKAERQREGFNI